VGVAEVKEAPILAGNVFEKHPRLSDHRDAQVIIERGIEIKIRLMRLEAAELEPLSAKILDKAGDLRILEHSPDLGGDDFRPAQRSLLGGSKQILIRHAAPQKVGEARGQLKISEVVGIGGGR